MATKKKLLQAAAGSAGGAALNVEDVFSTYLWDGAGGTQTIVNGVDLTEGGLVWAKQRSSTIKHVLSDSERGTTKVLSSNLTDAESTETNGFTSFNSDGFTFGSWAGLNNNGDTYASWTFRKAPKFFDIVTYTGNGSNRSISHNLGGTVGMLIIKRTDGSGNWYVLDVGTGKRGYLDYIGAAFSTASGLFFGDGSTYQAPTSTEFYLSSNGNINQNGSTYVAYLFAHNDGDGNFGPTGDQDIIKCGSYTGGGSSAPPTIDLGFEPQWVLVKSSSVSGTHWYIVDAMRGLVVGSDDAYLTPSATDVEGTAAFIEPTATGFKVAAVNSSYINGSGQTYIYIAIRRGPMAVPESATDVFDVVTRTGDATVRSTVPVNISVVDSVLNLTRSGSEAQCLGSRIAGNTFMFTNTSQAEVPISKIYWDYSDSFAWDDNNGNLNSSTYVDYAFKRAPNFFDVVAYSGNNTAGNAISHNLGVVPEMMWIKSRSNAVSWIVYHKDLNGGTNPEDYYLILNGTNAETNDSTGDYFNSTAPTATNFTLGGSYWVNGTSNIAYLFASLAGISKVGSYTGNGTSQTIDCGFTSGARFVLIKRTNGTGNWIVFDTARGIVSGTDPQLFLNTTDAEDTGHDLVDPASSGFVVNNDNTAFSYQEVNANGAEYIFYAIA